ncbi:(2Fe-2S)-binding protein [Oceanobacillus indicireducens]|uniref:(2Fe-2S)-binding protein n=1 Tax=Oceanobacillus indicireducens TaxID=1004261 RepID=A0A917XZ68_9BACI|nr:(2Fe-2S)-binding protein [Oceanobacillus indicireducens]GGN60083.1 (2Fe-2S)-binding protein [Oceanobacillus indicireducens]
MDKSTIVCRCEEINIDEIENALKNGAQTFDDIKRLTRTGMGSCQSKVCLHPVREIIADYHNKDLQDVGISRMRIPLKPIRMGTLATESKDSNVASVFGESVEEGDENR